MTFNDLGRTRDAIDALPRIQRHLGRRRRPARRGQGFARFGGFVIDLGDLPQSIRLYQQALTIFQKNGSEAGVAAVLNNLGVVYEAKGDHATAEKMYRQAKASFRLLDDEERASQWLPGTLPRNEWRRGICPARSSYMRSSCS